MSQRLMFAMSAVMTVTCLAVGGFAWMSVSQGRVTNQKLLEEGRASYEKLLETSRSENEELRDTLQALTKRLSPVKIRCLLEKSSGPPAEGFQVIMIGRKPVIFYQETTNSDGIADFGLIPSGHYDIRISTPWAENLEKVLGTASIPEVLKFALETKSGESYIKEIICPSSMPADDVEIAIDIDWPEDLREYKLLLFCTFQRIGRDVGGSRWESSIRYPSLCLTPDKKLVVIPNSRGSIPISRGRSGRSGNFVYLNEIEWKPIETVEWREQGYELRTFAIVSSQEIPEPITGPLNNLRLPILVVVPERLGQRGDRRGKNSPEILRLESPPQFDAVPGKLNHWTITLPENVLQRVRENLIQKS